MLYVAGKLKILETTVPVITAKSSIGTGNLHFVPTHGCEKISYFGLLREMEE